MTAKAQEPMKNKRFTEMKRLGKINCKSFVPGFFRRGGLSAMGVLWSAVLLLGSCSKEPQPVPSESPNGKQGLTLTFTPQSAETIDVKSVDAESLDRIGDLWVIQLSEAGTERLCDPVYLQSEDMTFEDGMGGRAVLEQFWPLPSRIYAIANTHNDTLYKNVTCEADILAGQGSLLTAHNLVVDGAPMSGTVRVTSATNEVSVPLYHAVAKVNFTWKCALPSGDMFTPNRIHLRQVPSTLQYFRDYDNLPDPASTPYPAIASGPVVIEWKTEDISHVAPATGSTFTWYLPENARGTGTATIATDKNFSTAPSGQEDYCTVAIVCGTYTSGTTVQEVSYHFYLGGDNINDYNLLRNREYNVTATIKGVSDIDMRVLVETEDGGDGWYYADWSYDDHGHNEKRVYTGRFLIAESDLPGTYSYSMAVTACPQGWRLPTIVELHLIWCMVDKEIVGSNGLTSSTYWSATMYNADYAFSSAFSNGDGPMYSSLDTYNNVRCIKDLW